MRAFPGIIGRTLVGISFILAAACSGDPTVTPATPTGTATPPVTPTSTAAPSLTPSASASVLPTPPGEGTFQLLAQFAAPLSAPLTPDTDSDSIYLANGDVVLSLEPATQGTTLVVTDNFATLNEFHGGEIGVRFIVPGEEEGCVRPRVAAPVKKTPIEDLRGAVKRRRRVFGFLFS
mgnify:CR=1 FL=1